MKLQMPKIKTVLITVAVLALLFIPTYIAIAVHSHAIKNPVTERAVSKITLTDPDGTSYTFEKGRDAESEYGEIRGNTISFFISLNRNSEPVSALPAAVRESTPFEVIYYSYNRCLRRLLHRSERQGIPREEGGCRRLCHLPVCPFAL